MKTISSVTPQAGNIPMQDNLQGKSDPKAVAKQMESVFLNEFLKIMMEQTSFGKDKTVATFLPVMTTEIAKSLSEKGIGIADFLMKNIETRVTNIVKDTRRLQDDKNPTPVARSAQSPITPPVTGRITSGYGMRQDPVDGKMRQHNGIDIAMPEGTPVMPAAPGKVVFSGNSGGYGNCVVIEHENGMATLYAHNSANNVKTGEVIDKNKVIALSGSTGKSTGPHLHFEVRRHGLPIDPMDAVG